MSWPVVALGEIAEIEMGQAPSGESYNLDHKGYPLIAGASDFGHLVPKASRHTTSPTKLSRVGDIIICIRATIGDINLSDLQYCLGRGVAGIRPKGNAVDPRYLWRAIEESADRLRSKGRGATFLQVSKKDILELAIPLPPLEEQRRIAGILDQADALRRLRTRALDKLNTLGQAIFHEMFGDVEHQTTRKLSEVAELINGDRSSNYPSGDDLKETGVLFLSTKNIREWRLVLDNVQYISKEKFASLSRGKMQRGDIVITLRGTLGQAAIFDCDNETGFINAQMMIIRPRSGINSQYLLDFLALDSTQQAFEKMQSGSAVKQLTSKQVGDLRVVVPSGFQQTEYALKIDAHQKSRLASLDQVRSIETLFASLQHRAFRGEL